MRNNSYARRLPLTHISENRADTEPAKVYMFLVTQPLKLYIANPADDGNTRGVQLCRDGQGAWTGHDVTVSGYLEPLP